MGEAIRFKMLNSIRAKLLVMILAANTLVVLAIFIANQIAFEKSFSQYIQGTARVSLIPVIEAFVKELKQQQNVDWIHPGSEPFEAIVMVYRQKGDLSPSAIQRRNELGYQQNQQDGFARRPPPPPPPREDQQGDRQRRPRFDDNNGFPRPRPEDEGRPRRPRPEDEGEFRRPRDDSGFDPRPAGRGAGEERLMFKTASNLIILGTERMAESALWIPLREGDDSGETAGTGRLLGYLGIENGSRVNAKFDLLFEKEQQRQFTYIAIIVLVLSFVVALPFSKYLVKPILTLRFNARELASGNYQVKLKPKSKDEIGQLARDMNRLAETLSANRLAQRQWIADISHELRTPIAVIRAELEGMMDGIIEMNDYAVKSLHDEMARLTRLVDDLHQLSLADRGALTYTMATINVSDVVRRVLDKHEGILLQRGFQVQFDAVSSGKLLGDAERLTQLFDNLMQNTLRYTDSSTAAPGQIQVTIAESAERIFVNWEDSAPGVSADKIEKLFERLYRVEDDRNRASGGSGLGLAICRSIVSAHHGEIQARTSPLGGVSMQIEFFKE